MGLPGSGMIWRQGFTHSLLGIITRGACGGEEIYVSKKLVSACLQEISRKEHLNYQKLVINFIKEAEEAKLLQE
jgi:hypothetical protein